jgi:hypothetical protein
VMRQVMLTEEDEELVPPLAVLRRGWGTGTQRGLVFLALLEQLDVPGCLIAVPDAGRTWFVGALAGKEVLLFDPRLGFPLPGPGRRGIATLSQLTERPEMPAMLSAMGYDVAPGKAIAAGPFLLCSLSALAPRMKLMQVSLGPSSRIRLSCDPATLPRPFKDVKALDGREIAFLPTRGDPLAPMRALRSFLPSEEGGADDTRWRHRRWELTLTPWNGLPQVVRNVPETIEPGVRLRNAFEQPFVDLVQKSGQSRDLMIRGRLADSVARLVEFREEVQRYLSVFHEQSGLDKELAAWCSDAMRLDTDVRVARRKMETAKDDPSRAGLEQAEQQMAAHWKKWDRVRQAVLGGAAAPLSSEIDYFLALAKHEQAELAQGRMDRRAEKSAEMTTATREAWQAAAERWQQSLDNPPLAWPLAGVVLNRARALDMLDQRVAAVALLESTAGKQKGWNAKALRYAAVQLKALLK